jgi:hypothetical protein
MRAPAGTDSRRSLSRSSAPGSRAGSWTILSQIIEAEARAFEPVVYLFDGIRPES